MTLMRYPGGFESEFYEWSNNTLDTNYKNYTATPGATPPHIIQNMGTGNVTFVVRTDALLANSAATYQSWAQTAASLVSTYGGSVKDWEIGNEWFNVSGAHSDYAGFLQRYSTLVQYYAPAMKAAAATKGYSINIYVTCNWVDGPSDMTTMQTEVGPTAWADVDGVNIHVYTGINPSSSKFFVPLPLSQVPSTIAGIKANSGKNLIYVSEWSADLEDNNSLGGLQNANCMLELFGQLAQSGITEAAYWPPIFSNSYPQADTITLVNNSGAYPLDADGQAFDLLSADYQGQSLTAAVTNSQVTAVAAQNGSRIVVLVSGWTVSGYSWTRIVSAQALYASPSQSVSSGPATLTNISASVVQVGGFNTAQFVINPGGTGRGSSYEIVKLVLQ
jgi:hypothetical protein